ncbi:uncharacterized protein STEHIDRAFT_157253 [Stereum hirsutum FP-91666 SS1]|uniref:uncharacterized protein n=1 Tax=Stereum hirsutum (strain FP-91666) TaxID=721885 RepID=UPI000444A5B3|nr:uncharacterized protein STEHIDRAFT_157253 [Stereum hirsutum FP-91666 SS1]EIM86966.1 hypothetical protein STEHIDRAFT_157253 [Stereum hirsutum FP-91666 SS1]
MLAIADPKYRPATRSELEDSQILNVAQWVRNTQLKDLRTEYNITHSFDGSTSNAHEARWTIHASTGNGKVVLVRTKEATAEKHDAKFMVALISEVAEDIGTTRIGCILSNGATACVLARKMSVAQFLKVAIALPNVCHLLNLLIKDIVRISCFKPIMTVICSTITVFHSSHGCFADLKISREHHRIGRGLEVIGKTRFATSVRSARSVQNNTPAIKDVVQTRKKYTLKLFGDGRVSSKVYRAAAYLNPNYLRSDLSLAEEPIDTLPGLRYPLLLHSVGEYLNELATRRLSHTGEGMPPFHLPLDETKLYGLRKWWEGLIGHADGQILPHLAIKILSIHINSMPEEHTVSNMNNTQPKNRNRMFTDMNGDRVQIRQYYKATRKPPAAATFDCVESPLHQTFDLEARLLRTRPIAPVIAITPAPERASTLESLFKPGHYIRDIKSKVFPSSDNIEDPISDEEGDNWLDDPLAIPGDVSKIRPIADTFINLRSEILKDLLADSETDLENTEALNTEGVKERSGGLKGDGNDENYSVLF